MYQIGSGILINDLNVAAHSSEQNFLVMQKSSWGLSFTPITLQGLIPNFAARWKFDNKLLHCTNTGTPSYCLVRVLCCGKVLYRELPTALDEKILDSDPDRHQNVIDWSLGHAYMSKKFRQNPFIACYTANCRFNPIC